MTVEKIHSADEVVVQTMHFVQRVLHASASIMCWIDGPQQFQLAYLDGVSSDLPRQYFGGMHRHDPLDIHALAARPAAVTRLSKVCASVPGGADEFLRFLATHGIRDEVDFLIRQNGRPVAALGALRAHGDPEPDIAEGALSAIHDYVEYVLQGSPRLRLRHRDERLRGEFGLTSRELEIAALVADGAANGDIAVILGIGLATVKTHVIHVFDKLGVDNRMAAASFMARL